MTRPRVLIGYSTSQATREAFERAGCETWTCDLLPAAGPHLQCDIWRALKLLPWNFAVLHPMCTYLTCSGAWAFKDGPFHQKIGPHVLTGAARHAARHAARQNFNALLDLPFPVAVENPAPSFAGTPSQIIQPYQFGDDASKRTGLWLTRGTPLLIPTRAVAPRLVHDRAGVLRVRWSNQAPSGAPKLSPTVDRWLLRSATYPGIAAAMGDQWGRWLNSQ